MAVVICNNSATRVHCQSTSCLWLCWQGEEVRSENVKPVNLMSPFAHWRLMFPPTEGSALEMLDLVSPNLGLLLFNEEDGRLCHRHFHGMVFTHRDWYGWQLEMSEMPEPFNCMNSKCLLSSGSRRIRGAPRSAKQACRVTGSLILEPVAGIERTNLIKQTPSQSPTVETTTKKEELSAPQSYTPVVWEWTSMEGQTGPIKTLANQRSCRKAADWFAVDSLTIRDWQWGSTYLAFVPSQRTWAEQKKRRATKMVLW